MNQNEATFIFILVVMAFLLTLMFQRGRNFWLTVFMTIVCSIFVIGLLCTPPMGWLILAYAFTNDRRERRGDTIPNSERLQQQTNVVLSDVASR